MSVNKVILVGFVGKEPEVRNLENSNKVANFSVATTEKGYKLQNGTEVPERTEWHNIVAWRGLADVAEKYIHKGTQIYVEGKIQTRSWEKDGVKRYSTDILAESIRMLGKRDAQEAPVSQQGVMNPPVVVNPSFNDEESGLPF
jgi:single-strand DNA-binding protein